MGGAAEQRAPDGEEPPAIDSGLACFILLARFLGVPADARQIGHDRGKGDGPYSLEDLSAVAKKLGLIGRIRRAEADQLHKLPLPAIAELTDGDAAIVLKVEEDAENPRLLVQLGDTERP